MNREGDCNAGLAREMRCFSLLPSQGAGMSLNRSEQLLFEYVQGHADERQYWQDKVRQIVQTAGDPHAVAVTLDAALWEYYRERGNVVPIFKQAIAREGLSRVSLRNLAEYWIRVWSVPRPKRPPARSGLVEGS